MKMSITMTDAEVREAIAAWLYEHGIPQSVEFQIIATVGETRHFVGLEGKTFVKIAVRIETEAPHMEGPYR